MGWGGGVWSVELGVGCRGWFVLVLGLLRGGGGWRMVGGSLDWDKAGCGVGYGFANGSWWAVGRGLMCLCMCLWKRFLGP